ncbi:type II secretion system F family protein [Paenibacillus glufosinatiresistens]|uniref:type II secretion system F family protein n=1 Tax=Paenibacillus glufosinatiresistens TaxID=3070657 RepID=UPI00286E876B|nr:type II secretion system F family protein [Paenibacillus sp. YX.27]
MKLICAAVAVLLAGLWAGLKLRLERSSRLKALRSLPMEGLRLRAAGEPMLALLERPAAKALFPGYVLRLQRSVQRIYGIRQSSERTLLFMAEMLAYAWLLLLGGCAMTLLGAGMAGLVMGLLLAVLVPAALGMDLHSKVRQREELILMELPELLNGILLLVGAGETVQRSIVRCMESRRDRTDHPLYREMFTLMAEWESGYSVQQAFENFSKRCAVQEVSLFTTTILLNHRRGGSDLALALRDLSRVLWEKRKAVSRTRGEQASSKLIFPMVLIFVIVMVLVGAPALMMLNM